MKKIIFTVVLYILTFNLYAQNKVLEKNTQPIENGIEVVSKLSPIQFEYETPKIFSNKIPKGTQYGIDTQKLKEILPQAVKESFFSVAKGKSTPIQTSVEKVDYLTLIPFLIAAIQEQQKEIEQLKTRL